MQARACLVLCAVIDVAVASPLGPPALGLGQNILQETGEITVNGAPVSVIRYTWRDSQGDPRSVSLVPASLATSGYAVQMTYLVNDGAKRTAYINGDPAGDGGFGYFVSHELFRNFSDGTEGTIAALHGEDDSPYGRYLSSTGSAQSVGQDQAVHEYRLNYPRWGTVASVPDPSIGTISPALADHQRFVLPVVLRWSFVAGQDYPLWSVDYDLGTASDHIASDVRGPYGTVVFNEGNGPNVTALRWGDKYNFVADAGNADFGNAALAPGALAWTWNVLNSGRRYNVLGSGAYEFGIVDTVLRSDSKYADGYSPSRTLTSAAGGCAYGMESVPCDYEWAYQSFQYDSGPPARAKLAWGSAPFLGSSITQAYNGVEFEPLDGKGHISYAVHVVLGRSGTGTPLALARAAAPLEATPSLTINASPAQGGSVGYAVLGDAGGPYSDGGRSLAPWTSVRLTAAPANGYTFGGWTNGCAGVASASCMIAMDQSKTVTALFNPTGSPPKVSLSETSYLFPSTSVGATSGGHAFTLSNTGNASLSVFGFAASSEFAQSNNCPATLAAAASCTIVATFTPAATGLRSGTITISDNASGNPHTISLTGNGDGCGADSDNDGVPNCVEAQEGLNAAVKDNNVFANARLFAMQQYRDFLNREGDSGGITFWTQQIDSGTQSRAQCAENFFNSTEFQSTVSPVVRLYFAYFLRVPDYAGLQFWISYYKSGHSIDEISNAFAGSAEFQGRYGALSNSQYVTLVYQNVLGRNPDSGGLAFWTNQLDTAARTRGQVMLGFSESAEYKSTSFNKVYVTMMYLGMLRRGPDQGGFDFWVGYMNSGNSGLALIGGFLTAPEYHNRFLP